MRSLSDTSFLPRLRLALYSLLICSSLILILLSSCLLGYQLIRTSGYNKPVPSLLTCSALTLAHCALFLSPIRLHSSPKRRLVQSLQVEIASLCVFGLFTLACVARLHESTPGLLSKCGPYFTCTALQGCLALGWLSFLFLAILFPSLLLATLYHHRRAHDSTIWREPFSSFAWDKYAPHSGSAAMGGLGGAAVGAARQQYGQKDGSGQFVLGEA
ncbi:hypothetical protein JCM8097_005527 [Rhodosporidiobolus ruineniae]